MALAAFSCWAAAVAASEQGSPTHLSEGNWALNRGDDRAANGSDCVAVPKAPSRIQVGLERLTVTGLPKNSIFNYQYRIDDGPASTPVIPSADMQNEGNLYFKGDVFDEILRGHRFRIRILDRWHEAISEDVDLAGLGHLHARMLDACKSGRPAPDVK
ncbi:hypothetical protein ACLBX9_16915 [Methylobacterium sp. A49B]